MTQSAPPPEFLRQLAQHHPGPSAQDLRAHWAQPRRLTIYSNTDMVGELIESQDVWSLQYAPQWISNPRGWDLSPMLPRLAGAITDGSTNRPVQWFFDNLLPEEAMRNAIAKDARVDVADAFGLLQYLGKESAGSLILLPPGEAPSEEEHWRALTLPELSTRIHLMPKVPMATTGPKRMSIAGAQQKLLVRWDGKDLWEPEGSTPSTHILKPQSDSADYPHTVINEYVMMRLAHGLGLNVPKVWRLYVPEPVYLVQRYDRDIRDGKHVRLHQVDTCQLINLSRTFKYNQASLQTLQQAIAQTRNKVQTLAHLWRWLVFNLLIGNNDNHLKNISFLLSEQGVQIAPAYDLLSTAVYHTPTYGLPPAWPQIDLAIPAPGVPRFADIDRASLLAGAALLGVAKSVATRELDRMLGDIVPRMDGLIQEIEQENTSLPENSRVYHGGELQLLRTIRYVVIGEMVERLR